MDTLEHRDVEAADLPDWRLVYHALQTRFLTGDFATGLRLVQEIGALAEEADHHPDLDLRYAHLNVRLYSHDVRGVTGTRAVARLLMRPSGCARPRGPGPRPRGSWR